MDLRPLHLPVAVSACALALTALVGTGFLAGRSDRGSLPVALGAAAAFLVVTAAALVAVAVRARALRAAAEERRRIARELHDGLAQELAFLVTQAKLVALSRPDVDGLHRLGETAQRALDEARLAITGLTSNGSETLDVAVETAAEEVAHREGVRVRLDLDREIEAPPDVRDAMVRIVREATTNAIRHGRAKALTIVLSGADGIRLEVIDDGVGFDPARLSATGGRFGLVSMSERARALGGDLSVVSEPGAGTRIEVAVP